MIKEQIIKLLKKIPNKYTIPIKITILVIVVITVLTSIFAAVGNLYSNSVYTPDIEWYHVYENDKIKLTITSEKDIKNLNFDVVFLTTTTNYYVKDLSDKKMNSGDKSNFIFDLDNITERLNGEKPTKIQVKVNDGKTKDYSKKAEMNVLIILTCLIGIGIIASSFGYVIYKDVRKKKVEEELRAEAQRRAEEEQRKINEERRRKADEEARQKREFERKAEEARQAEIERRKKEEEEAQLERLRKIKCQICNESSMGSVVCKNCMDRSRILGNELNSKRLNSYDSIHRYRQELMLSAINADTQFNKESACLKLIAISNILENGYKEHTQGKTFDFFKDLNANISKTELVAKYQLKETENQQNSILKSNDYRDQFPKTFRCKDGDYVRSKAEREIDDFFYDNRIWHIYEQEYKPPTANKNAESYFPDFYLPDYNLYIEYFGKSDADYVKKRDKKIAMYNSDKSIKFTYLTYKDDNYIYDRLKKICHEYYIPIK